VVGALRERRRGEADHADGACRDAVANGLAQQITLHFHSDLSNVRVSCTRFGTSASFLPVPGSAGREVAPARRKSTAVPESSNNFLTLEIPSARLLLFRNRRTTRGPGCSRGGGPRRWPQAR